MSGVEIAERKCMFNYGINYVVRLLTGVGYLTLLISFFACQEEGPKPDLPVENLYFPPNGGASWETISPQELGWNDAPLSAFENLLAENGTRAFILLKDGKIVMECYYGNRLVVNQPFVRESTWYWASAGKTLTAATVGVAQHEGFLSISQKSSDLLGEGWTSLPRDKEKLITIRHQLTMTTGLDDGVSNSEDYSASNLLYKADAGTRWSYHNAPYTLLDQVITAATGVDFSEYFQRSIGQKIGMTGTWQRVGFNNLYVSDARSMARFGLLVLAKGKWRDNIILTDPNFTGEMTHPSQNLNQGYGYLWWLNGQPSFMLPGAQATLPGSLFPNAPEDMVCGLGKDGQYVCVVPSENLVLVRMGESPDARLVPYTFLLDIWERLNAIMIK